MAIYSTPSGPYDFTFDATYPRVPYIPQFTGGQYDYTYDLSFSIRQTGNGSIAGSTFQTGGRNFVIRHHNVPTLKQSVAKSSGLQNFRDNIRRYQQTTPEQKATWQAQRQFYPRSRSNGTVRFMNRYHLFISSNQNLTYSNLNNLLAIGSVVSYPSFQLISAVIDYAGSSALFAFNLGTVPIGYALQLFASRPLEASEGSTARASLRLIRVFAPSESLVSNSFDDYTAVWTQGPRPPGSIFYAAAFLVPQQTGQKSQLAQVIGELI